MSSNCVSCQLVEHKLGDLFYPDYDGSDPIVFSTLPTMALIAL